MHVPIIGSGIQRQLCIGLRHFFCEIRVHSTRRASSSARHPYPFPSSVSPTPHEIFHLPHSASQGEIKARYVDLVKLYHPDTHFAQHAPPAVRNARFRAITHAYAALRGRSGSILGVDSDLRTSDDIMRAELRRRRRRYPTENSAPSHRPDDAQLTYVPLTIILVGVVTAMSLSRSHMQAVERQTQSAAANLAEARAGAEEYGIERRRMIKERLGKMQQEKGVKASETGQTVEKAPPNIDNGIPES